MKLIGTQIYEIKYNEIDLLVSIKSKWQFGAWEELTEIEIKNIEKYSFRAHIALIIGAAHLQLGNTSKGQHLLKLSLEWGIDKKQILNILVSGTLNNLGRCYIHLEDLTKAKNFFKSSVAISTSDSDEILSLGRYLKQVNQLKMLACVMNNAHEDVGDGIFFQGLYENPLEMDSFNTTNYENFSSSEYWESRYKLGGNSGFGSYGKLAQFKANIINKFIKDQDIRDIIEFGCGDGNQLSIINIKKYIGIDVSNSIIEHCKSKFNHDSTKLFITLDEFKKNPKSSELTLSLDVIFHLVENSVFEDYMYTLFGASERFCIIYSCDEGANKDDAIHVRRRKFTEWIIHNINGWRLMQIIYNKQYSDGRNNPKDSSFSNFYIYERL